MLIFSIKKATPNGVAFLVMMWSGGDYSPANLTLSATKRDSYFWILNQLVLKTINVIRKRTIAFGQAFCLTKKLFSIVKCHHTALDLSSKFLYQIKGRTWTAHRRHRRRAALLVEVGR